MLLGSEQLDAPASGCGATGIPPVSPAGRANLIFERGHWAFDPVAYRRERLALIVAPAAYGAAACAFVTFAGFVMLLVAAGAR